MSGPAEIYAAKLRDAAKAVADIADAETIAAGMAIGQPPALLAAIADRVRCNDLKGLKLYYKIAMAPLATTLLAEGVIEKLDARSFFIAGPDHAIIKRQVQTGRKLLSFVPVNFSQLPRLFEEFIALDSFVVTVSPMDAGGYFSPRTNNNFSAPRSAAASA
jgi:itaconate CoA-transferase